MCEADLKCRRLAPAWKLVATVLNNAMSFDCCAVPPEALVSYAQELDDIVDALMPMFVGQDRLEHVSIKKNAFAQECWRIWRLRAVPREERTGFLARTTRSERVSHGWRDVH